MTGTGAIAEHLLVGPSRLVLGNHPTANGQLALNHEGRWWDASDAHSSRDSLQDSANQ